jgi:protoheme IX farnesyltransferase
MSPPVLAQPLEAPEASVSGTGSGRSDPLGRASRVFLDLLQLTKPRITSFVVLATAAGFFLGARGAVAPLLVLHTLLATALLSAAASALNQVIERHLDARMERTCDRPLPSGRLHPGAALCLGIASAAAGILELALAANVLAALLGALSLTSYLFAYTPLKRRTHHATLVGGLPGALPPVIGWAASSGEVNPGAVALFAVLFLWQLPHFLAIARLYRDDYARAGFPVLPVADPDGSATARAIVMNCLALLPAGLVPSYLGLTGPASSVGSLALGLGFLGFGIDAALRQGRGPARRLLLASLVYLPAIFILYIIDKV